MALKTNGGRPPTLSDVARLAGVSQSTASRVVNGSTRRVDESIRDRVLDAARQLGYAPNIAAQAVARGESRKVALITGGIADAYFSSMTDAVMRAAEESDLRVSLAVSSRRPERELELVRELRGEQPRAIILAGTGFTDARAGTEVEAELLRYQQTGGRVVLISRTDMPFETVDFDNLDGARRLAVELIDRGYRAPLVIGSALPLRSMQQRIEGFVAGFAEAGIAVPPSRVLRPEFTWDGAKSLVRELPSSILDTTDVLFAVTDDLALGALSGLRDLGIDAPGRIGVAGFDDIATLRDVVPALTSVHVPLDEVAHEAIRRATTSVDELQRRIIPTHPVIRASTPPR